MKLQENMDSKNLLEIFLIKIIIKGSILGTPKRASWRIKYRMYQILEISSFLKKEEKKISLDNKRFKSNIASQNNSLGGK